MIFYESLKKVIFAYSVSIVELFARGHYIVVYCIECLYMHKNSDMIPATLIEVLLSRCVEKLPSASGFTMHCTVGIMYTSPWFPMTGAGRADIDIAFSATKK